MKGDCVHTYTYAYLSAAWWKQLKPLLLATVMSAPPSSNRATISSLFLEMVSCRGVSPSASWRERRGGGGGREREEKRNRYMYRTHAQYAHIHTPVDYSDSCASENSDDTDRPEAATCSALFPCDSLETTIGAESLRQRGRGERYLERDRAQNKRGRSTR